MCLILLAWQAHPEFPLVVAANRDEYFSRPTAAADFWTRQGHPEILAGCDLQAGGSWMGISRTGRFAALTNFRQPENRETATPSRGTLVSDFLAGTLSAEAYLSSLETEAADFRGFNLLCGTPDGGLWRCANRGPSGESGHFMQPLALGIYGLSNSLLDIPWPKVAQGKSDLARALCALPHEAPLFDLLHDEKLHDEAMLPRTGVSLDWERTLSAAFVRSPGYGTRSSTVVKLDRNGFMTFDEQTWLINAQPGNRRRFRFRLTGRDAF
jgi:uncharacterized protein with NRDE domain